MSNRQNQNRALVTLLSQLIEQYPTLRFSQILSNFNFVKQSDTINDPSWVDEYFVEPDVIMARVAEQLAKTGG